MVLWRISRHGDLSGIGGLKASGRWHYAGQPVVYLSESPASTLLEVCVHTASTDIPPDFTLLCIDGPDFTPRVISVSALREGWQSDLDATREIGTKWLRGANEVFLAVPSAIVPLTSNFIFNPLHSRAKDFRIRDRFVYPFDERIKT